MKNKLITIINGLKSFIKSEIDKVNHRIDNSKSDWNETNENSNSYIKNKPFGENIVRSLVLPETTLEFVTTGYDGRLSCSSELNFVHGEKYIVTWDGVEYECIADSMSGEAIGNASILIGSYTGNFNNNAPFFIWSSGQVIVKKIGQHTFKIEKEDTKFHQIDQKYLPEHLQFGEYVLLQCTFTSYDGSANAIEYVCQTDKIQDLYNIMLNNEVLWMEINGTTEKLVRTILKTDDGNGLEFSPENSNVGYRFQVWDTRSIKYNNYNATMPATFEAKFYLFKQIDQKYIPSISVSGGSKTYYYDSRGNNYIVDEECYNAIITFINNPSVGMPNVVVKKGDNRIYTIIWVSLVKDEGWSQSLNGVRLGVSNDQDFDIVICPTQKDADSIEGHDMA